MSKPKGQCRVEGCMKTEYARGLCTAHYHKQRRAKEAAGRFDSAPTDPLAIRIITDPNAWNAEEWLNAN